MYVLFDPYLIISSALSWKICTVLLAQSYRPIIEFSPAPSPETAVVYCMFVLSGPYLDSPQHLLQRQLWCTVCFYSLAPT